MDGWIVGRKEICRYVGCEDWRTVRNLKKCGLPVHCLPPNKPAIIPTEADDWLRSWAMLKPARRD